MRNRFDEQLETLNKELIDMGAMCEEIIGTVSNALFTDAPDLPKQIAPLAGEIDQAEDIAEIISFLHGRQEECGSLIKEMADAAGAMVRESVNAYVNRDIITAENVIREDDTVDDYFSRIKTRLIERIGSAPEDGEFVLDLLMIAKYLERIGDHAVNIAEWVIFSITGVHKEA